MQKPDIYSLSIVLLGNFNPIIINPHWLELKGLIRASDKDQEGIIEVVHPEVSKFDLSFAKIQVTKDRFQLDCYNEAEFILCKDLVISIFRYLAETPIRGIGINHTRHFKLKDVNEFKKFGHWLVPVEPWNDDLKEPGVLELKMVENENPDAKVRNTVIISPSGVVRPLGVSFQLNYHIHFDRISDATVDGTIEKHWELSAVKAMNLYENILKRFQNE
ncbi:hypothetical protein EZV76_04880 [Flagellimonas alvinocaridis]|uniref:TIGR04255 family protein n=1 Tax=Flagellimonas alvinocaridis TaxID=2530200 RepID=A0A4S8RUU5_9FLAO|nr:hypothetical protein [Allomuricauda alvinocaridis]THV61671.1 hypothetical protein EZV76_04880 [Allomuricauda alvinocaridis]